MSALKTTLQGYLSYKGREGHLGFVLHRLTGLGTLLFLVIHIFDMAAFYWWPTFFEDALNLYRTPPFMLGEIVLVFCVLYHGANGLRIAFVDMFAPHKWAIHAQRNAVRWTMAIATILWLPAAIIMGSRLFGG